MRFRARITKTVADGSDSDSGISTVTDDVAEGGWAAEARIGFATRVRV